MATPQTRGHSPGGFKNHRRHDRSLPIHVAYAHARSQNSSSCKTRLSRGSTGCATKNERPGQSARMTSAHPNPTQPRAQRVRATGDFGEMQNMRQSGKNRRPRVRWASNAPAPSWMPANRIEETSQPPRPSPVDPRGRSARWPFSTAQSPMSSKPRQCRKTPGATATDEATSSLHWLPQLPQLSAR